MSSDGSQVAPNRALVIAAFAAVYLIWGSTYLGIRYAVDSIPPFLMAGSRFFAAGVVLFLWARRKHLPWPGLVQWRDATIVGTLMLLGGNGGVTWAEQTIPSSVAALMIAMTPLWIVLLDWRTSGGSRPTAKTIAGLALGFIGVGMLVLNGKGYDGGALNGWGLLALLIATLTWASGSLFSRRAAKPQSALLAIGMQMITGGAVMTLVGVGAGELRTFDFASVTALSAGAWIYLMLFGALVGFTAYIWLLQVCPASKVSTYAFVNPLIAVTLGCTLGNEPFSSRLVLATALIGFAVLLIILSGSAGKQNSRTRPTILNPGSAAERPCT